MRYDINPTLSRLTLKVHATGMLSAFGHSPTIVARDVTGQVTVPDDAGGAASVELSVKAASLTVGEDVKESDRREIEQIMRRDVLEVDKYPDIRFTSTEITGVTPGSGSFRVVIKGTLDLHRMSQPEEIEALVNMMGDRLTANGKGTLRQSRYGVKPVSIAAGGLKLKDDIDLSFDIVARAAQAG